MTDTKNESRGQVSEAGVKGGRGVTFFRTDKQKENIKKALEHRLSLYIDPTRSLNWTECAAKCEIAPTTSSTWPTQMGYS